MLRPAGVLEDMVWNIDMFTCVLVCSEFSSCVSSIGNWIVLGFPLLKLGDVVVLT